MLDMFFIPMLTTVTVDITIETFELLQPYFGHLSCMPVPCVTQGVTNNVIVVKLVEPQSTYLDWDISI